MNVISEIKIGQCRVIDYLLSPLKKVGSESLKDRCHVDA